MFTLRCLITISSPTTSLALVPYAFTTCIPLQRKNTKPSSWCKKWNAEINNWIKFMQLLCVFFCCLTFCNFRTIFQSFFINILFCWHKKINQLNNKYTDSFIYTHTHTFTHDDNLIAFFQIIHLHFQDTTKPHKKIKSLRFLNHEFFAPSFSFHSFKEDDLEVIPSDKQNKTHSKKEDSLMNSLKMN